MDNSKQEFFLNIPVILGTAREGRYSEKVADFILNETIKFGLKTELIDVRNFRIKATDNTGQLPEAEILSNKIGAADGLIIVTPEYNHGYPGELKMMLDLLYEEYAKKPVGFCGVSSGILGGARAVEQLRQVITELHMISIREALYFPLINGLFDEAGQIKDKSCYDRAKKFLEELTWYAQCLKKARKK